MLRIEPASRRHTPPRLLCHRVEHEEPPVDHVGDSPGIARRLDLLPPPVVSPPGQVEAIQTLVLPLQPFPEFTDAGRAVACKRIKNRRPTRRALFRLASDVPHAERAMLAIALHDGPREVLPRIAGAGVVQAGAGRSAHRPCRVRFRHHRASLLGHDHTVGIPPHDPEGNHVIDEIQRNAQIVPHGKVHEAVNVIELELSLPRVVHAPLDPESQIRHAEIASHPHVVIPVHRRRRRRPVVLRAVDEGQVLARPESFHETSLRSATMGVVCLVPARCSRASRSELPVTPAW